MVKVSCILTTCPYFDNLEFDIFNADGPRYHFIASFTIAFRILTLSVHYLKLNLVCKINLRYSKRGRHQYDIQYAALVKIVA